MMTQPLLYLCVLFLSLCSPLSASDRGSTVIILNGPSSAGKSSIQRELQQLFDKPYLGTGIDDFLTFLPKRYVGEKTPDQKGINIVRKKEEGYPLVFLEFEEEGQRVIHGMHASIVALANEGNNVIVDHIFYDPTWCKDLTERLKNHNVVLVGVYCPLEELERREAERGKLTPNRARIVGHTRTHYQTVHLGCSYDIEVNTKAQNSKACARAIKDFVDSNSNFNSCSSG